MLWRHEVLCRTRLRLNHSVTDDWRLPAIGLYLSLGFDPVMEREDMPSRWRAIMAELEKPRRVS